jgi:hypothetical protein
MPIPKRALRFATCIDLIAERIAKDSECLDNRFNDKKDYIMVCDCGSGS